MSLSISLSTRSLLGLPLAVACLAPIAAAPAFADAPMVGYHLVRKIPLTGANGWDYLTADSATHRLYVSQSSHVVVIDTTTGKVIGDIPDTAGVHGIALDPKTGHGFTSNGRSNSVTMFDIKTLKKLGETPVGQGPDAIIFDPASQRVFTFNGQAQTATALDAASGKVIDTVTLPGRPEFPVSDGKGHLYDNIEDKSEIVAIDAKTLQVTHTWSLAPGDGPSGLAIDRKGRRLFAVCGNQKMIVMDADTGKVVATPTIGNGPDAAAYDGGAKLVFSPNGEDGTLTVLKQVSPNQYTVVATVTTQSGARTMALDEKTHHIFTVAAQTVPPTPGENQPRWRRSYVDGSVTVLEFAP
jgi:DNA-binding beta-propeller fold protein YncE